MTAESESDSFVVVESATIEQQPATIEQQLLVEQPVEEQRLPPFHIVVVLDESGSMGSLGSKPQDSVNDFVQQMRDAKLNRDVYFSLYRFGEAVLTSYKHVPLADVVPFTTYKPYGNTPMYDGIGQALTDNKENYNGVCHIITDGHENASVKFTNTQIVALIDEMTKTREWTFQYTGAGPETFNVAAQLGVRSGATVQYDSAQTCNGGSVAMGYAAGQNAQSKYAIAIGRLARNYMQQSAAIGCQAGNQSQQNNSVAIGCQAGNQSQQNNSVAIGCLAGNQLQSGGLVV